MNDINLEKVSSKKSRASNNSPHMSHSSDTSNVTLVMFNAQNADLVDLNNIEPLPRYLSTRNALEVINTTFLRACKLKQMVHGDKLDVNLTMENIAHIAEVLEMISDQKTQLKKM